MKLLTNIGVLMRITKETIKKLRKTMGCSTTEFGEKIGVTKRTVECWEQGVKPGGSAKILIRQLMKIYKTQ